MNPTFFWLLGCLAFSVSTAALSAKDAAASPPSDPARWVGLPIGGGGYVIGIVAHPTEKDLVYIRTDVGGCYRWNAADESWIPLLDSFGPDESNFYGVDGLALDPQNPDVVYIAAGKYPNASDPNSPDPAGRARRSQCDVLKSTDRGVTWQRTGLDQPFGANGGNGMRIKGECLAVDPLDGNILLSGTVRAGLWITEQAAQPGSWRRIESLPADAMIHALAFAPEARPSGRSRTIYGGTPKGVLVSRDAGQTWSQLGEFSGEVYGLRVASDGTVFVAHNVGVARYRDGAWKEIAPNPGKRFSGISVASENPRRIAASERVDGFLSPLWFSEDAGDTWRKVHASENNVNPVSYLPWKPTKYFAATTSELILDPCVPGRAWFTDWYATWRCDDIAAAVTTWQLHVRGHEEIVALTLSCPPAGARVIAGVADVDGFRYEDVTRYPERKLGGDTEIQETQGIAFCESQPDVLMRVTSQGWGKRNHRVLRSEDNGRTWKSVALPEGAQTGKIALSATDPLNAVYAPGNQVPWVTADGGQTWSACAGLPSAIGGAQWSWHHNLAADTGKGAVFYALKDGAFFRSSDHGKTWSRTATLPGSDKYSAVRALPGRAGAVWVNLRHHGLFRSENGGDSFERVAAVESARLFDFGAPAAGSATPAAYLYGTIGGVEGIFRSDDLGASWVRINDDAHKIGNDPNCLAADRQVHGVVYIGTNGRGIFTCVPRP